MALLTRSQVFGDQAQGFNKSAARSVAKAVLLSEAKVASTAQFDIFLSHSSRDASEVLALKRFLSARNYTVYVDWIDDRNLDRTAVSVETAAALKQRLVQSKSLLVCVTQSAKESRWVPWELGLADGLGKRVGVIPIVEDGTDTDAYDGSEYLGLYPYVDYAQTADKSHWYFWVNRSPRKYVRLRNWLTGAEPELHRP